VAIVSVGQPVRDALAGPLVGGENILVPNMLAVVSEKRRKAVAGLMRASVLQANQRKSRFFEPGPTQTLSASDALAERRINK